MEKKWTDSEAKKKITLITLGLSIFVLLTVILFSIDLGSLYEVAQHPDDFYASEAIGLSMYPQIYTGDLLVIQEATCPGFEVTIGDILIFNYNQHTVGHRVTGIHPDYYITRGDNNRGVERVYSSQVVGRVHKIVYRNNPIEQHAFGLVVN